LESNALERLWDQLLSRQADEVRQAFLGLAPLDRQAVLAHLQRMSQETDWHPEQRKSADFALQTLAEFDQTTGI
jgi:uncharacterized protein with von Willebrand factor type A (vWA) domain